MQMEVGEMSFPSQRIVVAGAVEDLGEMRKPARERR